MINYQTPGGYFDEEEFLNDLRRIKYVKRLLNKHKNGGELKTRLVLNHIILLANVFGVEATVRMLYYKIDVGLHNYLFAFLTFLDYISDAEHDVNVYRIIQHENV